MCISTEQISLPLKKTIINKISRKIKQLECDLILVAIGSPKQDLVIYELSQELSNLTYIPCGASLDFQYKLKKRAPVLLQKLSMEWIWRALSEPRRLLPRYFKDLIFFLEINYRIKNESRNREKL
jgi:N-acetylglucosaminyldiphosphoundecaprenol N-acetyl-beta-D-mannosaminyltransferase